jgi:hypothetical protein
VGFRRVGAGPFVQIGATLRAQAPTVGAAQGSHGSGQERRLAKFLVEVEIPPVVKDDIVVLFELALEASAAAGPIRVELERELERRLEALETTGAFLQALGRDPGGNRDLVSRTVGVDFDVEREGPLLGRQPESGRWHGLNRPRVSGLKIRQFKA